jgi:membrane fusion protein, heavy metal efflux system
MKLRYRFNHLRKSALVDLLKRTRWKSGHLWPRPLLHFIKRALARQSSPANVGLQYRGILRGPEGRLFQGCRSRDLAQCFLSFACISAIAFLTACDGAKTNANAEAPPQPNVQADFDPNNFAVDRPELFPLATAAEHKAVTSLNATGIVQPDIARALPVISLASGRVVEIKAKLGDVVTKGQLLMRVQSNDVSGAFQTYIKAENDERLAHLQLDRAQTLYDHGATSKGALEQTQVAEEDARADLNAASEQLRLLGINKEHPSGIVDVVAPISGVITDQQVTNSSGVQGISGPNPFTISDLSYVWIICDVYENDLDAVHVGEYADIHLNAYPNQVVRGRIDNILPVLDPNIRTAKVRIEVPNSGSMRVGMFVTATFYGKQPVTRAVVPATAILHLHDRNWVYASLGSGHFKRQEVTTGATLPGNMQEVVSGLKPGDQVVSNALELQNTVEQ